MEHFTYKLLKTLDEKFGTPFFIMDVEQYKNNVTDFINAFKRKYNKVVAGYSFKTNYVPTLCRIAKEQGCFAEVVSDMEYALAEKLGFNNIILNGPIKRPDIMEHALNNGAIINLDSEYEVAFVCRYKQQHKEQDVKVGMRININPLDENGNSTIQYGLRFGRFGFPDDIIKQNIEELHKVGISIISLHGHTSTSDRAVLNYRIITQYMLSVCEKYQLNELRYFDIGGGFFGAAPDGMDLTNRPKYEDYADCVLGETMKSKWFMKQKPYIVIEPGSSVVSNVFRYFTKVYQNKKVGNANFVMVDGTIFDIKPTMHANNLPHDVFRAKNINGTYICDVVGSTCMEKDVLLKEVKLPLLSASDYIQFRGVGAYTICLTPTFINYLGPILMFKNGEYQEVRRRQTIEDIVQIYKV